MPRGTKAKNFFEGGFNLPELEKKVLQFWKEHQIFAKSLKNREGRKTFVFYEGPPTANGKPGIHHVLARSFKDIVPRYRTMRGFFVPRKAGWDTHGLAVEIEVEKKLGLKSKKDIEKYGVAEFNEKCRESVWEYKDEWERLTERMAFWLDTEHPYITYEPSYIESLWWIIASLFKKDLMYKGHKVVPWCTRCGTALSSHELALGYKEVRDNSVYVKFKVKGKDNTFILSWTTTPWTLPGNVALAVGEDIAYVEVESDGERYILAKDAAERLGYGSSKKEVRGKSLVGLKYEPLFDAKALQNDKSHKVYAADFVTTEDGTGVVHTAVMYGEDDYRLGLEVGLPQHHTVDEQGKFTKDVPELAGLYVKAKETEEKILEYLKVRGNLLKIEEYVHEYPHCWRCSTPLLYYARTSWFVAVSKLRDKLLKNNKEINWIPEHLKEGRFGEWLKDAKDWNFSRERYWGTPLPIWECKKCAHTEAIESFEALSKKSQEKIKNTYLLMRHGEAETNVLDIHYDGTDKYHLTDKGKKQVEAAAKKLRKEGIDLIVSSDVIRTKETAALLGETLGVKVEYEERLREILAGAFSGRHTEEYHKLFPPHEKFEKAPPGGETLREVRTRVWNLFKDLEKKHSHKKILIVSHDHVLAMLYQALQGLTEKQILTHLEHKGEWPDFFKNADVKPITFSSMPRNESGEIDPHRPYVDAVSWKCEKCDGEMLRVKELADVWFDSGSMPFASIHYPFQNNEFIDKGTFFPADYISEGMDQTRGWFYTLLAVSTLLGLEVPYKNVISLGLINDKHGQKMSKSKGNVVDPWDMAEKYGMDAVRWYFYSATPPGETKNFDEAEIGKTIRRFHLILYNALVFYETYGIKNARGESQNILDRWIGARLEETISEATQSFEAYDIRRAALSLESFTDDLSRWYIRRSRRRFQPDREINMPKEELIEDHEAASATLFKVITTLAKLLAPFSPFTAEALYHALQPEKESVHLEDWPEDPKKIDTKLITLMRETRRLASAALASRAAQGLKVRQPLRALSIKNKDITADESMTEVLKDEVNVKEIIFSSGLSEEVELDMEITVELREEGRMRELVRMVQGLRQEAGYNPKDKIQLFVEADTSLREAFEKNTAQILKEVNAGDIQFKRSDKVDANLSSKFEEKDIWIGVKKVKS